MLIKAAIFDMDGLMLDTERLGLDVFRRVIAELGFDPLDEVYLSTVGRNWFDTREIFLKALGERFPFDEMRERWLKYNDDHVAKFGIPHKTGLLRLVQRIQVLSLPRAVATSTMREKALALLKRVNLLHHFDAVVGGDEVTRGKPDPEIFQHAARRLGVDPKQCVVFEDSVAGIRAAYAAAMIPVLVPDLLQPDPDVIQICHRVYASLDEAHALFESPRGVGYHSHSCATF